MRRLTQRAGEAPARPTARAVRGRRARAARLERGDGLEDGGAAGDEVLNDLCFEAEEKGGIQR